MSLVPSRACRLAVGFDVSGWLEDFVGCGFIGFGGAETRDLNLLLPFFPLMCLPPPEADGGCGCCEPYESS